MAPIISPASQHCVTVNTVRTCYDLMRVMQACGLTDFTDGKYDSERHDRAAYVAAQERQAEYLLDQVRCATGTRLLDIGCGYGRILEHARRRGAEAVGITISAPQVSDCRARGLDVYERNYRELLSNPLPGRSGELNSFDAIIANGSLEHFVQVHDAAAGRADEIYQEMFAICRRLLLGGNRFVTTAIHFREADQFDPAKIVRGPAAHPRGSASYHYSLLVACFGGWYPAPGQLERCAVDHFELIDEEDGTYDYCRTSEFWLRRLKQRLAYDPRVWWAIRKQLWQRPRAALRMLRLQLIDQSWPWQFRDSAPMRLLRQTWLAK